MSRPTTHPLALSDHTTDVAQVGDTGPAVVLLHALGLTWQTWEPVMHRLGRVRRVLAYDLRGRLAFSWLDVVGRLGDLTVPTLVVCGDRDASTSPAVMRAMPARLPHSRYVELVGAPHMPTLETPVPFAATLDGFLPRSAS